MKTMRIIVRRHSPNFLLIEIPETGEVFCNYRSEGAKPLGLPQHWGCFSELEFLAGPRHEIDSHFTSGGYKAPHWASFSSLTEEYEEATEEQVEFIRRIASGEQLLLVVAHELGIFHSRCVECAARYGRENVCGAWDSHPQEFIA